MSAKTTSSATLMTFVHDGGERICTRCGRRMARRRGWRGDQTARYGSKACRSRRLVRRDRRLETAILELLAATNEGASICPSEAARRVAQGDTWRELMESARQAALRLTHAGVVEITQRGRVVDPGDFRGPIRIRAASGSRDD